MTRPHHWSLPDPPEGFLFKNGRKKEASMESLEIFGILLVILGVIGMAVMLRGGSPIHHFMTSSGTGNDLDV
jgi:hypothetical protein